MSVLQVDTFPSSMLSLLSKPWELSVATGQGDVGSPVTREGTGLGGHTQSQCQGDRIG